MGTRTMLALGRDDRVTEVVGVARRPPPEGTFGATWVAADITRDDLSATLAGADAVVHLAWVLQPSRRPAELDAVNVGGTARVLEAARAAHVSSIVVVSSLGVYSPAPPGTVADEEWPTEGVTASLYSRQKVQVERMLDRFESEFPLVRVVRLRPTLAFHREAAAEIRRLFLGPFVPGRLIDPRFIPVVPDIPGLAFQAVHTDDVAEACRLAVIGSSRGAFNIASDELLDAAALGRILGARPVRIPARWLRTVASITWRLHLQPTDPGWIDLALAAPILGITRAREELQWRPRHTSSETLLELLRGFKERATGETAALGARDRPR
jgi:nucleoside-diphosphate-sugar epimerase